MLALAASGSRGSELKRRIVRLLSDPQRLRLTRGDSLTLLLFLSLIAGALAGFWRQNVAAPPDKSDANATVPAAEKQNDGKQAADRQTKLEFSGKVIDAAGHPVAGAEILVAPSILDSGLDVRGAKIRQFAISDARGHFAFAMEPMKSVGLDPMNWTHRSRVFAKAPGYGCDWLPLQVFQTNPVSSLKRDELQQNFDKHYGPGRFASQSLKLPLEAGPVRGRLIDLEGHPLVGVSVSVESILNPDPVEVSRAFERSSRDLFDQTLNDSDVPGSWRLINRAEWQVLFPSIKTNENGEFSLRGLGRDQMATVSVSGERVAAERFYILGTEMETMRLPHISHYPNGAMDVFVGTHFSYAIGPAIPVSGTVSELKSGKPIANATVVVERLFGREGLRSSVQLRLDTDHIRAITDEHGRYQLDGIPPGEAHVLMVIPPKTEPWLVAEQELSLNSAQANATVNLQVFRGVWIEGKVTDAQTGEPIRGIVNYFPFRKNPDLSRFGIGNSENEQRFVIDELGQYRVPALPGPGVVAATSSGEKLYPAAAGADKIEGYDVKSGRLPSVMMSSIYNFHQISFVEPSVGADSYPLDITLSSGVTFHGCVVAPDGSPVANVEVQGQVLRYPGSRKLKDDKFSVVDYSEEHPRDLFFSSLNESLVAYLHLEGKAPEELEELKVQLQPAVTVRGRVIDTQKDEPAAGFHLYSESSKLGKFLIVFKQTDDHGRFELTGLLAGNSYKIDAYHHTGRRRGFTIDLTNAKPGDVIELGDVTGKNAMSK